MKKRLIIIALSLFFAGVVMAETAVKCVPSGCPIVKKKTCSTTAACPLEQKKPCCGTPDCPMDPAKCDKAKAVGCPIAAKNCPATAAKKCGVNCAKPCCGGVALFDGKTFDGWVQRGGKAKYTIKNGMIVGTTLKGTPNSFMCTKKTMAILD